MSEVIYNAISGETTILCDFCGIEAKGFFETPPSSDAKSFEQLGWVCSNDGTSDGSHRDRCPACAHKSFTEVPTQLAADALLTEVMTGPVFCAATLRTIDREKSFETEKRLAGALLYITRDDASLRRVNAFLKPFGVELIPGDKPKT